MLLVVFFPPIYDSFALTFYAHKEIKLKGLSYGKLETLALSVIFHTENDVHHKHQMTN